MIDIHCHILDGVDDGVENKKHAIDTLDLAEKAGFTDVILTPHYIKGYYDNNKDFISKKIKELKTEVYNSNILVNLHQGNEIYVSEDMPQLLSTSVCSTLANSKYVLFELPMNNKMINDLNLIMNLKQEGYIPVLAHPERYCYVQENINLICDYVRAGAIIQSNFGSIVGVYGRDAKKTVERLLENDMVHILATDTHKEALIYKNIDKIIKETSRYVTKEQIKRLTYDNPKCIIQDERFEKIDPKKIDDRKKFFFIEY